MARCRLELLKSGLVHMGRNQGSMENRLSPHIGIRNESLAARRVAFSIVTGCEFSYLLLISDSYRAFVSPYLHTHFQTEMEASDRYASRLLTLEWREGQFLGDFDMNGPCNCLTNYFCH